MKMLLRNSCHHDQECCIKLCTSLLYTATFYFSYIPGVNSENFKEINVQEVLKFEKEKSEILLQHHFKIYLAFLAGKEKTSCSLQIAQTVYKSFNMYITALVCVDMKYSCCLSSLYGNFINF